MKKTILLKLLSLVLTLCATLMLFSACGGNKNAEIVDNRDAQIVSIYNTYVAYAESNGQTPLSYEDWLSSIKGEKGEDGQDGKSAYQLWIDLGNNGSEQDFLNWIKGADGQDGVGIESVRIDENGHLKIKYTNSQAEIDLGKVKETENYSKDLSFELNDEQTGYVLTGVGYCSDRKIVIPSQYMDKPVVAIKESAFANDDFIKRVEIPDSVTNIGERAFYSCDFLESVTIGNSVTSIGEWAFSGCDSLESIVIGDSVTSIGDYAFSECYSLTSVDYMGTIDQWVQIKFDDSSSNPLYFAKKLYINNELVTEANITTATKINSYAFSVCDSLTSIEIGNSVTSIGEYVFLGCSSLTSIVIPDSVTSIGDYAFSDCSSLTSIEIGDSVTSIGERAFFNCSSLISITVDSNNTVYKSIDGNLYSKDGKTLIQYAIGKTATTFTIPDSVTSIGDYAFYNCLSLTSIVIGDSVTSIGDYAFYNCLSLTSIVIGDSVTSIGVRAFYGCDSLESIVIPDSVTSIGDWAFYYCSSLESIVIPDSVTSIGDYAFSECYSLTSIEIGDSVTSIGDHAFSYCSSLESIVIPDSVTSIGQGAFFDYSSSKSIKYRGTEAQWSAITKGYNLGNYSVIYNYAE